MSAFFVCMKYSNELTQEICKYLRAGNNIEDSCDLCDISKETFYQWKKKYSDFIDAIKKAEKECKARNIAFVLKAGEKTWQAAAWWLERKYHDEFALKTVTDNNTTIKGPIEIKIVEDKRNNNNE